VAANAVKIERPRYQGNAYFCRKGFYSLNMQAVCDAERRITWMSVLTCGSTHDSVAFLQSGLGKIMIDTEHPIHATDLWVAGDDAYKGVANRSKSLLTPFPGKRLSEADDAFNAYQSICRIEIEDTFGAFVKRWGVLQRPLSCSVPHATLLLEALCKLHNVCMERKIPVVKGRVMADSYGNVDLTGPDRHGGADLQGTHWPEARVPNEFFDPAVSLYPGRMDSAHRAQCQPLRNRLRDLLDHGHAEPVRRPVPTNRPVYRGYTAG
jgi:hypothetical protein